MKLNLDVDTTPERGAPDRLTPGGDQPLCIPALLQGLSAELETLAMDCRDLEAVVSGLLPTRPNVNLIAGLQRLDPVIQTLDSLALILGALSQAAPQTLIIRDIVLNAVSLATLAERLSARATVKSSGLGETCPLLGEPKTSNLDVEFW